MAWKKRQFVNCWHFSYFYRTFFFVHSVNRWTWSWGHEKWSSMRQFVVIWLRAVSFNFPLVRPVPLKKKECVASLFFRLILFNWFLFFWSCRRLLEKLDKLLLVENGCFVVRWQCYVLKKSFFDVLLSLFGLKWPNGFEMKSVDNMEKLPSLLVPSRFRYYSFVSNEKFHSEHYLKGSLWRIVMFAFARPNQLSWLMFRNLCLVIAVSHHVVHVSWLVIDARLFFCFSFFIALNSFNCFGFGSLRLMD